MWITDASESAPYVQALKEGLRELGWVDGRTMRVIERYDNYDPAIRPALAAELVAQNVNVLYVLNPILPAARRATQTIPMVCPDFFDPIEEGVTSSLARPDRNATGISWQSTEAAIRRLQLTRELIPRARRIGWLFDGTDPGAAIELRGALAAARAAGVAIEKFELRTSGDMECRRRCIESTS